jgi:nucleoside-diphosphate-sugar epimerase
MAFSLAPDSPVEYVHTRDAATAIANVLDRPEAHDQIHLIGGGRECQVTTLQLTQTMIGAIGLQVTADHMGDVQAAAPWLDTTESQRLLSYQEHTAEDFRRESLEKFRFIRPLVRPLSPLIMPALKRWLRA